jgi:hypothetical protein
VTATRATQDAGGCPSARSWANWPTVYRRRPKQTGRR